MTCNLCGTTITAAGGAEKSSLPPDPERGRALVFPLLGGEGGVA